VRRCEVDSNGSESGLYRLNEVTIQQSDDSVLMLLSKQASCQGGLPSGFPADVNFTSLTTLT
jgi:hypothetical protein